MSKETYRCPGCGGKFYVKTGDKVMCLTCSMNWPEKFALSNGWLKKEKP